MKIDRECINDNAVEICKEVSDGIWDSITGEMKDDDVRFLIANLAYLNGVCVFADKLKEVLEQSIDAVEVVRCKDCFHYESDGGAMMTCNVTDTVCDDDDYCSYGERKEVEE